MNYLRCIISILILTLFVFPEISHAKKPQHLFKIASLAPDGSVWAQRFEDFAETVKTKSDGNIGFKIYPGGVMGDDRSMFRKMKIGQLHGGGFTMTGIGEIVPDFRVLGIPFLFTSYEEVDKVIEDLIPSFKKAFAEKGLVLLAMSEVGFIYTMSTKSITTLADLKSSKSWVPEGDSVSALFFDTIGINPTPLSIPDVLTSLQTGLIDTVYNAYYGAIVMQWFTRTKYITDIPFTYGYGALVLDKKKFSRLSAEYIEIMESAATTHFATLLADTRKSNAEALTVLQDNGISVVAATEDIKQKLESTREKAVIRMIGNSFSQEIYDQTMESLLSVRNCDTK